MNRLEKWIYNRIRYNPSLKKRIVNIYQRLLAPFTNTNIISEFPIKTREGYFFGFHDKTPWSPDNSMLLAHKFVHPMKIPGPNDGMQVGFFGGENYEQFTQVASTKTWNWQMGAMLQWVGNSSRIIFNDFDGEHHIARMINTAGDELRRYPEPIAAVGPKGRYAISLSFNRLRRADPAYGYAMGTEQNLDENIPASAGLTIMNLDTEETHFLFSLKDLYNYHTSSSMKDAYHYFTHPLFSPSGNRFVFFHRWKMPNGQIWTRMFSSDRTGEDIHLFKANGTVTHVAWKDEKTILAYANKKEEGDNYYLFEDRTDHYTIVGEEAFRSDGHPQFSPSGNFFITDTYPNRFRKQHLILYNIIQQERRDIAELYSPIEYNGVVRCDLHPRWDRNGKRICFDSAYTGIRALCTINLEGANVFH